MSNKIIKKQAYFFIYRKIIMNKAKKYKSYRFNISIILLTATYIIPNPENLNILAWHTRSSIINGLLVVN